MFAYEIYSLQFEDKLNGWFLKNISISRHDLIMISHEFGSEESLISLYDYIDQFLIGKLCWNIYKFKNIIEVLKMKYWIVINYS